MDLTNTKVGDKLVVARDLGQSIATVTRTTKTLVMCDNLCFNRCGRLRGSSRWDATHAHPATAEEISKLEEAQHRCNCVRQILSRFGNQKSLETLSTARLEDLSRLARQIL
jgi:hypothetical protein